MTPTLPLPAQTLAPHAPPMLLVSRLLSCEEGVAVAEALLQPGCPALDQDGSLLPEALPELMAQAYALVAGYQGQAQGKSPQPGMLVGLRQLRILTLPRVGDRLEIHVEASGRFADFVMVQGSVQLHGEILAQAELKLYLAGTEAPPVPRS